MNNNKTTNILLGILIVVLVAIGIIMATNQNRNSYRNDMMRNNDSIMDNRNDISIPVKSNSPQQVSTTTTTQKSVNWSTIPTAAVEALFKKTGIFFDSTPTLDQSIDLTGDGVNEGVYGAQAGNGGIELIAIANSDGSTSLAQMKTKDGKIILAELDSYGSAGTNESYKLLPEGRGFYRISRSYNEQLDRLACTTDSVDAYQWNPKTSLFEYNSALTAKYTAIECK